MVIRFSQLTACLAVDGRGSAVCPSVPAAWDEYLPLLKMKSILGWTIVTRAGKEENMN